MLLFRGKPNPLLRHFGLTAGTGFSVAVASVLVVAVLGRTLGPVLLGEYLLVRRLVSWLQSGVQVCSGVALPRFVAHTVEKPLWEKQAYFLAALGCGSAFAISLALALNAGKHILAPLLFGNANLAKLMLPISLLLLGLAVHGAVFGYYQGCLAMGRANALQICDLVLIPLVCVALLYRIHSIPLIMDAIGLLMILCSVAFALAIVSDFQFPKHLSVRQRASELLSYGIPRIPGDFGLEGLMSLGPLVASHFVPVASVAYFLLANSLLAGIAVGALPLGIVLLSKVSMMLAQNRRAELQNQLTHFVTALVELGAFLSLQLLVFADDVVRLWVGSSFTGSTRIVRILLLAVPFYLLYAGLRSVIDAGSATAYNARNIIISLCGFLLLLVPVILLLPSRLILEGIVSCTVVAFVTLAALTFHSLGRLYGVGLNWQKSLPALVVSVLLAGTSVFFRASRLVSGAAQSVLLELFVVTLFVVALKKLGSDWMAFFSKWVLVRQPGVPVGEESKIG